ncbi:sulfate/molybdate ABC transporter ATP-binding protein [Ferrovibrio sp.]|uniref:sulfate/molybdate ABC transporter ATP-binding protein n=1 Tax=Ferrovibrio sp. TaxID=1917215 RepID=UPI0025C62427|nr:sulfate/molybdate ABC transporter ATP-binding protein [Ferrovibrio sp.]MBX3455116.1 sulfate/molybdate ABC transporter ATP-binding protein [Ferrovibrio sp.]
MSIAIRGITKSFGTTPVLRGIDLDIADGELVALLGASGSGKTTLLRILAGLDWPDQGDVQVDGTDWLALETQKRHVGFVFQHYALFQHMRVRDNVAFGLNVRPRGQRPAADEIRAQVDELLNLVQIGNLGDRFPSQLSGGQRQRVALARALAIKPKLLLLDEPFGALDARIRKDLRRWLRELHEQLGMTTIFVTHDQEEAFELADRVVVMGQGRIEQIGTPDEIYDAPASPFVARFLGNVNEITAEIADGHISVSGAETDGLQRLAAGDGAIQLFVRPHEILLEAASDAPARIRAIASNGPVLRFDVDLPSYAKPLEVIIPREAPLARSLRRGDAVRVHIQHGRVFHPALHAANQQDQQLQAPALHSSL